MADRIINNRSLADKESRILPKLSPIEQNSYVQLRQEAIKIEQSNPSLDTSANTKFVSDYLDAALNHRRLLDDYRLRAKTNGIVPDSRAIGQMSNNLRNEFINDFHQQSLPRYGEQGKEAHSKLIKAMNGDSIPEAMVGQFYKSEKGGVRWGGIAGGLIAGLLVFTQMGGMAGGLLGFAATAVAALAGAWLMNKGVDTVSGYMGGKSEPSPQATKPRTPSIDPRNMADRSTAPSKLPDLTGEIIPNQLISGATDITVAGNFSPGSIPAKVNLTDNGLQTPANSNKRS